LLGAVVEAALVLSAVTEALAAAMDLMVLPVGRLMKGEAGLPAVAVAQEPARDRHRVPVVQVIPTAETAVAEVTETGVTAELRLLQ
jgi:hypothetical protein